MIIIIDVKYETLFVPRVLAILAFVKTTQHPINVHATMVIRVGTATSLSTIAPVRLVSQLNAIPGVTGHH